MDLRFLYFPVKFSKYSIHSSISFFDFIGLHLRYFVLLSQAMSKPSSSHKFGLSDAEDSEDDSPHFISAVCWKSESPTMLAANSQGTVKVLVLAP
jgi:hypothetical protein